MPGLSRRIGKVKAVVSTKVGSSLVSVQGRR